MSDGQSALLSTHDTQHQVSAPADDQQIVSLSSMSTVVTSSLKAADEVAANIPTASSLIFLTAVPHTQSYW